ncbi:MAG: PH domain-containing protein [Chitinophagaceae bacterium]|nr:PH domain-containing protein [Chitinophagaceae bacterium]
MEQHQTWNKPARPSPVMILTGIGELFRELLGFVFIALIAAYIKDVSSGDNEPFSRSLKYFIIGTLAGITIFKIHKITGWFFTKFWMEGDQLILTKGVFVKQRIELPLQKLQTIQLHQDLIHRLTHTCKVTADTAGTSEAEFVIDALALDKAEALRTLIQGTYKTFASDQAAEIEHATPIDEKTISLKPLELFRLFISENHLKSLALILLFIFQKAIDIGEQIDFDSVGYIEQKAGHVQPGLSAMVSLFLLAVLLSLLVSAVRVFMRYYGYTIRTDSSVFHFSWGLTAKQHKSMPVARIEFITWQATWLRRKLHMFTLRMHSLAESITEQNLHVQVPVPGKELLHSLIAPYGSHFHVLEKCPASGIEKAYAYRRSLLMGVPSGLILMGLLWYQQPAFIWLGIAWILYFSATQWVFCNNFMLRINKGHLLIEKGIWGRKYLLVALSNIVFVSVKTTPWQRKHGYANLVIYLPGEVWTVPYLRLKHASNLADEITMRIESKGIIPDEAENPTVAN